MHRPDPAVDIEEILSVLSELVQAGKLRYIGSSSFSGSQIVEAQWAAKTNHYARFVSEQLPYSVLVRGVEADVLPTVQRHGMGALTFSPLAGGWLSGRWRKEVASTPTSPARPNTRFDMSNPANQRKLEIVEDLALLAEMAGVSLIELAIAFVINHPGVTSAIVGPRTLDQLRCYLPAAEATLLPEMLDRIDEIISPGITLNVHDTNHGIHELSPVARRR